ncbi:hypothetical protein B0H10DRAFT_2200033 [Mycena sp. CBHHK59/15]|nr:hypothetical protein B0H10DRAFT_2200033 [Mycena sp. CBHHK59/15]
MASHYQAHPGPGPSNYYIQPQSPPPQNYPYGPVSPGPVPPAGPNGYPYQYNGPPPIMNSHHPGIPPQGSSPRMNGRGGGSGNGAGYLPQSPRGYQPQPHPTYRPPYAAAPYTHPQNQMPPKYPHAYQPPQPYAYAPPPPPASAWGGHQHQEPLSPHPKDPPMSPLQDVSATLVTPTSPYYAAPPPAPSQKQNEFSEVPSTVPPPTPSMVPPPTPPTDTTPTSPNLPTTASYAQIGSISASSSASSPKPAHAEFPAAPSDISTVATPPASPRQNSGSGGGGWAIWSRRPLDPAHAPGIIISPRANPPPDVVFHALDARTPPASPALKPVVLEVAPSPVPDLDRRSSEPEDFVEEAAESEVAETPSSGVSTTDAPSTTTTTVPSSPVSSNTSLSLSVKPAAEETSTSQDTTPAVSQELTAPAASQEQDVPAPAPAPATAPTAPAKKSWASLLRPAAGAPGSAPASAAPRKNGLPTSSVVGFSVPAAPAPAVDNARRAEVLALLSGVAAAGAGTPAATERLVPRGLVNTGNMCFANAVLQVLVYCAPFAQLFARLRVLMVGGASGVGVETPMVRATGEFLREFVVEEKAKGVNGNTNGGGGSNGGYGYGGKGKGKERAPAEEQEAEDEEAFIPTYVYDALKDKKRFDHMRGGHQEDAEEFLGFYLDTLEEELLSIVAAFSPPRTKAPAAVVEEREEEEPPETEDGWLEVGRKNRTVVTRTIKTAESPITRIFGGKFRSTLRAPGQKDSVIVEDWRSLRLDIQRDQIHTLQDALSFISHPQTVQMTHSARPGVVVDASQQILVEALPSVLVLHIKRFCYDKEVGGVVKVGKQIAFGPELDIPSDVMVPTARKPARYKLFGAVYHHGVSASGGHYTLDVLHPTRFPATGPAAKPREGGCASTTSWCRTCGRTMCSARRSGTTRGVVIHAKMMGRSQDFAVPDYRVLSRPGDLTIYIEYPIPIRLAQVSDRNPGHSSLPPCLVLGFTIRQIVSSRASMLVTAP